MHALQVMIRKQLSAAWRHRWPAVLFTWLVCALGWGMTFLIPNQYESSARLFVDADAVLTPLLRGVAVESTSQVDTLQRTLLSRPNLEKLISKTDLELSLKGPADRELMVQSLATAIRIAPQTRNLFTISYRNQSPQLARDVVQTMLNTFVESKAGNNRTDLENAGKFFQDQIAQYERQLRDAEKRRAEFRTKYIDLLPNDGGVTRLEVAQGNVRTLQGQLTDALARRDTLAKELGTTPQTVVTETEGPGGGGGGGGNARLRDAERQLQELRLRYTDQHPDVVAQRNLVASIRSGGGPAEPGAAAPARTGPRNRSAPNPVYEQLKLRMVENDSAISSLQRQTTDAIKERDRLEEIARSAPTLQAEFVNLNRDYDVLRKQYEELLSRRESMRISTAADLEGDKVKVQVIDPPQVPQNPVAPKRLLLISGVLLAGIGAGIGLALLLVQMDQSFHSVEELRDLGFPVMGGVSMIGSAVPFARRAVAVAAFGVAAAVPMVVYSGILLKLVRSGALL